MEEKWLVPPDDTGARMGVHECLNLKEKQVLKIKKRKMLCLLILIYLT